MHRLVYTLSEWHHFFRNDVGDSMNIAFGASMSYRTHLYLFSEISKISNEHLHPGDDKAIPQSSGGFGEWTMKNPGQWVYRASSGELFVWRSESNMHEFGSMASLLKGEPKILKETDLG